MPTHTEQLGHICRIISMVAATPNLAAANCPPFMTH